MKNTVEQAFNNIGKQQEGVPSDSIKFATLIAGNYEPIIDGLKVVVAGYGSYKAAVSLTAAAQRASALSTFVQEYFAMGKALGFATANQIAFNRATLVNPYVSAATALFALVSSVVMFSAETTEATLAQERALGIIERLNERHAEETTKNPGFVEEIQVFKMIGDSMNSGRNGDFLNIEKITQDNTITNRSKNKNRIYVFQTRWGLMVKEVTCIEEKSVFCTSLNPDKDLYPDFEIEFSDISVIYEVTSETRTL